MIWSTFKFFIFCISILLAGQWIHFQEKSLNAHIANWITLTKNSTTLKEVGVKSEKIAESMAEGTKNLAKKLSVQFSNHGKKYSEFDDNLNENDRNELQSLLRDNH